MEQKERGEGRGRRSKSIARTVFKQGERAEATSAGSCAFFFSDDTSRGSVDLSPLSSSLVTALCEFRVYIYVSPFFSLVFLFFFPCSFSSFFYLWRNKRWRFDEG